MMLRTVRDACTIDPIVREYREAGGIETLVRAIEAKDKGESFFARTYMTAGMEKLLHEALLRLSGNSGQALFELAQAMGGGKTHLMSALGLLAKNPEMRAEVLGPEIGQEVGRESAKVVVFDGRDKPDNFLWGAVADQIGPHAAEVMKRFHENGPSAPGKQHWIEAIGDAPVLILFDELPPYFLDAATRPVGSKTLADVLTGALSNLFAAALELPRCCIVLSNLESSYGPESKRISTIVDTVNKEAKRQAKKILPVDLSGDEIYQILRKRLFQAIPGPDDIEDVVDAYVEQVRKAEGAGYFKLSTTSAEQFAEEIRESYPFHPSFKHLIALFKNNPNFKETRGLLQFSAQLVRSVWQRTSNDVFLIGTQHLDLQDREVSALINEINPALKNAQVRDIADKGMSHAEEIDAEMNGDAASQVARLLLSASLSQAVGGHRGLKGGEIIEYLVAPNRKAEEFDSAFQRLRQTCWYLHKEEETYYFKDTENLIKRIQNDARNLPEGRVNAALVNILTGYLTPKRKRAYQEVLVMPDTNEIRRRTQRFLVVVKPDNSVPPEDIRRFYRALEEKNLLLVLSGHDTHNLDRLDQTLREMIAVEGILKRITDNESLHVEAQAAYEKAQQSFNQVLQNSFNRIYFPAPSADDEDEGKLEMATIENGLRFSDGERSAEVQLEELLSSDRCSNKLARDEGAEWMHPYLRMLEERLWPENQNRIPWVDIVRRAAKVPLWPWLPGTKGLEELKRRALEEGRWREGSDGYVERGPFPAEKTALTVTERDQDEAAGTTLLELTPRHAGQTPRVHYAKTPDVSEASPVVDNLESFSTDAPTLYFLVVDPSGEHESGEPVRWLTRIRVKRAILTKPEWREMELQAFPPDVEIRYTLDGSNPREGVLYDGPFRVPDEHTVVQIYAVAGESEYSTIFQVRANTSDEHGRPVIDEAAPATLTRQCQFDGEKVFTLLNKLRGAQLTLKGVRLDLKQADPTDDFVRLNFHSMEVSLKQCEQAITEVRKILGEKTTEVSMRISDVVHFDTGRNLKIFAETAGIELTHNNVQQ